jgi:signal transduction histidine kinase
MAESVVTGPTPSLQRPLRPSTPERVLLVTLFGVVAAGVFLFDLEMPIGIGVSVLYTPLILLTLRSPGAGPTWLAALAATALTVLGLLIDVGSEAEEHWKAYVNRTASILSFWAMAALGVAYKRRRERYEIERTAALRAEHLATLGELTAGLAHELGTPLGVLQGRLELLDQKLASGRADLDEVSRTVHIASALGDRMVRIVRAVRSLARDASADPLEEVALGPLLQDVLAVAEERLRKAEVEVRVEPVAERLRVPCREAQLSQVLLNLILNAAEAVQDLPERWIRIEASERPDSIEIAVVDSGRGVPEAIRDKVMQPFFSTKAGSESSGLGLSVSRTFVESHAGTLSIDASAPHTRFVVSLPVHR